MRFWDRLTGRETRNRATVAHDPYLATVMPHRAALGGSVDTDRASGLSVAHACVQAVAATLAGMPAPLYRQRDDGGRVVAEDHPLQHVLNVHASDGMTAFEFREALTASVLTHGNGFARIAWNGRGQVTALHILDPRSVGVEVLEGGRRRYRVTDPRGRSLTHTQGEMLHVRYRIGRDGVTGMSPIALAAQTFGTGLDQQDQARRQAAAGDRPQGVLSFRDPVGHEAKAGMLDALGAKAEAVGRAGGVLVLDGGVTWAPMQFSAKDAEFLESRRMTDLAIARVFGAPPTAVGITDHATYANADAEARALVQRALAPMARRLEAAMNAALLTATTRRTHHVEHDLSALLRGDMTARFEAYRVGREAGFLSPNEIRAFEGLGPIEGGDTYVQPLNMGALGEGRNDG